MNVREARLTSAGEAGSADVSELLIDHLDLWTGAVTTRSTAGRGRHGKIELTGIKKLRELILELAVRGKLVDQSPDDEPGSVLLERIAEEKARLVKEGKIKKPKKLPEITEEEKPFGLPEGWAWARLGNISQINPRNDADDEVIASFIPMPMITTSFHGEHEQEARPWGEIKKGYTHFADGDIAIAKITPCFENSKAAVFRNLQCGIGAGTTELHIARPFGEMLNPFYILLCLKSPRFLSIGEQKMTGSAGQKRVPKDFFSGEPLPFPALKEQHRIVEKVDELMALCDRLEQQVGNQLEAHKVLVDTLLGALIRSTGAAEVAENWARIAEHFDTLFTTETSIENLKQTILQLAVMGRLVEQDPDDEPASKLLDKIAEEKVRLVKEGKIKKSKIISTPHAEEVPFLVPKNWNWCRLESVALHSESGWSPQCNNNPRNGDEWGVLKVSAVSWGSFNPDENKALPASLTPRPELEVKPNDFLISRANTAELVARSAVVTEGVPKHLMMSDKIVRFVFSGQVNALYINLLNNSKVSRDYYSRVAGGTSSSMKNVSRKQVQELLVPLPPKNEQRRIVEKIDELMALCDQLKARLGEAGETRTHLAEAVVEQAAS